MVNILSWVAFELLRYYYLASFKSNDNDYKPDNQSCFRKPYTNSTDVIKGKLKGCKALFVLKYYIPNKHSQPEEYVHHILFMYFLFRGEKHFKFNNSCV